MSSLLEIKPVEILLVKDNPVDIRMTKEAFKDARLINNLNIVTDGEAAIEYVRSTGPCKGVERPDLVLLDLNLAKKDGWEVLEEIKTDDELKSIPVAILTASDEMDDVKHAYAHMASCYITKPIELEKFLDVVTQMGDFWLSVVKLPSPHESDK
jgi:CheY-like chemotaxis protein